MFSSIECVIRDCNRLLTPSSLLGAERANGEENMTPVRLIGFHEMDSALVDEAAQGGGAGEGNGAKNADSQDGNGDNDDSASSLSDDQRSTGTTGYPDTGNGMSDLEVVLFNVHGMSHSLEVVPFCPRWN